MPIFLGNGSTQAARRRVQSVADIDYCYSPSELDPDLLLCPTNKGGGCRMTYRICGVRALAFGVAILGLSACGSPDVADTNDRQEAVSPSDTAASGTEEPEVTGDYSDETIEAAQTCHDKVWLEDERFSEFPNAAVSINPTTLDDNDPTIGWIVEWDNPQVSASGTCLVEGDNVTVVDD